MNWAKYQEKLLYFTVFAIVTNSGRSFRKSFTTSEWSFIAARWRAVWPCCLRKHNKPSCDFCHIDAAIWNLMEHFVCVVLSHRRFVYIN